MNDTTAKEDYIFKFQYTYDGSVGLYNNNVEDVYHSIYGAKTEGWEKFVLPLDFDNNLSNKNSLKVLDICFGIGYNTKAFLKKIITSNYQGNVYIDALEYDKNLVFLSPFVKDGYFKSYPEISFALLCNLYSIIIDNKTDFIDTILSTNVYKYIEPFYRDFIKKNVISRYIYDPLVIKKTFVHNIYYHCISLRNKRYVKPLKNENISINPYFNDARNVIKALDSKYDVIFLDAFTPTKLPTLWSLDLFKELYRLSNDSTQLITYSNSSAVRHAMTDAGFYVGKLFDKNNRHCGTIATLNKDLIKVPLNDYDIGLMKTSAGVYFRDKTLSNTAEEIINEYTNRKLSLNLESSSQYIKKYKKQTENNNEAI